VAFRLISSFNGSVAFFLVVAAIYIAVLVVQRRRPEALKRLGLKLEGGVILYRTERLNRSIARVAERHATAIKVFGDVSAVAGFALMVYGLYFFHRNLVSFLAHPETASPVSPVVPGLTVGLDVLPYFLLAVFLAIAPHELAHALTASAEGLRVKSTGLFLAAVFPGGFAEIDEDQLEKAGLRAKLRVLSSGSAANILTFIILVPLMVALVQPVGVKVTGVMPGYPAASSLKPGDIIISVNGFKTPTLETFANAMAGLHPGDKVNLTVLRGRSELTFSLTLATHPGNASRGFLGVQIQQAVSDENTYNLLMWSLMVTSSVAVINMLPVVPLDGGRVFKALLEKLIGEQKARFAAGAATLYTVALVAVNIYLSTNIFGLLPFP